MCRAPPPASLSQPKGLWAGTDQDGRMGGRGRGRRARPIADDDEGREEKGRRGRRSKTGCGVLASRDDEEDDDDDIWYIVRQVPLPKPRGGSRGAAPAATGGWSEPKTKAVDASARSSLCVRSRSAVARLDRSPTQAPQLSYPSNNYQY
ncbi:hypothetical protein CDD83_3509 [Cordyceps sp. RAO-2017]|nr:hypothetical protein CDD83_3509 [Cordyceps sp. RAO-2017]